MCLAFTLVPSLIVYDKEQRYMSLIHGKFHGFKAAILKYAN